MSRPAWPGMVRRHLAALPLALLLIGFLAVPLGWMLWDSVGGFSLNLEPYADVFSDATTRAILRRTLAIGALVTLCTLLISYPLAYFMTTLRGRMLALFGILILIPLFTAFLIRTYAWMVILGREGIVNNLLLAIGAIDQPVKILGTEMAVVIGMVHAFTPMAVFTLYSALSRIDRNLVRAAETLGAHPVRSFTRIYLPLSLPGVLSAAVLVFIISIGFYVTPALLGGPGDMMMPQLIVMQMTTLLDFERGYASAMLLLLMTLLTLSIASLFIPLEKVWSNGVSPGEQLRTQEPRFAAPPGAIRRWLMPALGWIEDAIFRVMRPAIAHARMFQAAHALLVLGFLLGPLIVIVMLSFSASAFVVFPPPGFSWQWWSRLAEAPDWHRAFLFSLKLGACVAAGATVIATLSAFWMVRTEMRGKRAIFLMALAPLITPTVIIAVALYVFEARLGMLGTFGGLALGHILLAAPYAIVVLSSAVHGLDRSLEHAAAIHGANPGQVLRRITLPLLKPSMLTAGLLAFITSFDELIVGLFLLGRQTTTLPIKFWGDIRFQIDPLLSTASTLIVVLVTLLIVFAHGWRAHRENRLRGLRAQKE